MSKLKAFLVAASVLMLEQNEAKAIEPTTVIMAIGILDKLTSKPTPNPTIPVLLANRTLLIELHGRLDTLEQGLAEVILELEMLPETILKTHLDAQRVAIGNRIVAVGQSSVDGYIDFASDQLIAEISAEGLALLRNDFREMLRTSIIELERLSRDLMQRSDSHGVSSLTLIAAAHFELLLRIQFQKEFGGSRSAIGTAAARYSDSISMALDPNTDGSLTHLLAEVDFHIAAEIDRLRLVPFGECQDVFGKRVCQNSEANTKLVDLTSNQRLPSGSVYPECAISAASEFKRTSDVGSNGYYHFACVHEIEITFGPPESIAHQLFPSCEVNYSEEFHTIVAGIRTASTQTGFNHPEICTSVSSSSAASTGCVVAVTGINTTEGCVPKNMRWLQFKDEPIVSADSRILEVSAALAKLEELIEFRSLLQKIQVSVVQQRDTVDQVTKGNLSAVSFAGIGQYSGAQLEAAILDYTRYEIDTNGNKYQDFIDHTEERRNRITLLISDQNRELRDVFLAASKNGNSSFLENLHLVASVYSLITSFDAPAVSTEVEAEEVIVKLREFTNNNVGRTPAERVAIRKMDDIVSVVEYWSGVHNTKNQLLRMNEAYKAVQATVPIGEVREFDAFSVRQEFCCFVPAGQSILSADQRFIGTYKIGGGIPFEPVNWTP